MRLNAMNRMFTRAEIRPRFLLHVNFKTTADVFMPVFSRFFVRKYLYNFG